MVLADFSSDIALQSLKKVHDFEMSPSKKREREKGRFHTKF